ncbi:CheR family methyltransferase [Leptospira interrogans]|uniref:CheR family methyltransferase n=1 Tax=Leptospira interrogans TaxID=173 RepID=UPI000772FC61|nr:protein-glutamate O-methyltransferase CheR [Leptospira interrogans]
MSEDTLFTKKRNKFYSDFEGDQPFKLKESFMKSRDIQDTEINLLLEVIFEKYGYDFRQYSEAHIRRRLISRLALSGLSSISEMQTQVLQDKTFASKLLQDLSITVTEMFRDPDFYVCLRKKVIPILKTYPFVKIWHAGCSTGEEAYSMAIILKEEGLYERSILYATDFNEQALNVAREGIFRNRSMKEYTINYQLSGGSGFFSDYYTSDGEMVIMNQTLKKNIVWAHHNLVTDRVFAEVNLVFCRNVLIYFKRELQNQVHHLFLESLVKGGILCLGSKEGISYGGLAEKYESLDSKQKIYKKKY